MNSKQSAVEENLLSATRARFSDQGKLLLLTAEVEKLRGLLKRADRQLSKWHEIYGQHQPEWLPPGGDVELQEDISAAMGKEKRDGT